MRLPCQLAGGPIKRGYRAHQRVLLMPRASPGDRAPLRGYRPGYKATANYRVGTAAPGCPAEALSASASVGAITFGWNFHPAIVVSAIRAVRKTAAAEIEGANYGRHYWPGGRRNSVF